MGLFLCSEYSTNTSFKGNNDNCIIYLDLFTLLSFTWQLLLLRPKCIKVCVLKLQNSTRWKYSSHFWFFKPILSYTSRCLHCYTNYYKGYLNWYQQRQMAPSLGSTLSEDWRATMGSSARELKSDRFKQDLQAFPLA